MKHSLAIVVSWVAFAAVAEAQSPFDGLYYPTGSAGWDCRTLGADMGALGVLDGFLEGVENRCAMTNPVNVRDLPAVLYDLECSGEGTTYAERVMLMRSDQGIYVIRDGYVAEWSRCP
ncbi:hypothetical protein [Aliiruegeria lutimaris]|uniref:Uncharacterized protein n=1 Tax=Aliiruegeria lutimaris TaxID=571298 RepID=A0A1G8TJ52_9RHOB|nr:hypothetical protein [Aliiruegeria lutimaris]SDJ40935.1 hypothetical protein SAMN04488026_10177 [Aliiruegeria lutimaris]